VNPLLARQRSDRAFERLYQKHAGDVYRYALVILRNQADAEGVTQTTFMNAYRAFERGERPRAPQNWLIAIAHNVCRQRFRQSQRRPNEVELNEELAEAVVEEDSISAEDIRRALGHLGFNQRAALVMRELEGRSYQEIAEILGLSISAVETLIFRARRALREQLEEGITCHEAELAISRQLDGRLSRKQKGALRAHLRECDECAHFARKQRAQRGAIKSLAAIPLPQSLASLFGGGGAATGGAAVGTGIAVKAAAIGASAVVATGVGYEGARHTIWKPEAAKHAAAAAKAHASSRAAPLYVPTVPRTDLRPFRPASIRARRVDHGHPAVVHQTGRREVSVLPPSRERTHDLKPSHPVHPVHLVHPVHPVKPVTPTHTNKRHSPPPKKTPPKHEATPPAPLPTPPPPDHTKGGGKPNR
jgi:RNA polymerase sigma-70 factor (ECF subfamily)